MPTSRKNLNQFFSSETSTNSPPFLQLKPTEITLTTQNNNKVIISPIDLDISEIQCDQS